MNGRIIIKGIGISLVILMIGIALFPAISGNAGLVTIFSDDKENSISTEGAVEPEKLTLIEITKPTDGASKLEPATYEKLDIAIEVVDQLGRPVFDAGIHVYREDQSTPCFDGYTNEEGKLVWTVENGIVSHNTNFTIKADKIISEEEVLMDEVTIEIRNMKLEVIPSEDPVDEFAEFYCTVVDQDGFPVPLALVKFNADAKYTKIDGTTDYFTAPSVNYNMTKRIRAVANLRGYDEDYYNITIIDCYTPSPISIDGEIRNYFFEPMEDVEITIITDAETYTATTDEFGNYEIGVTIDPAGETVTIEAYHPEYPPQSVEVKIEGTIEEPIPINFWLVNGDEGGVQKVVYGLPGSQGQQSPLNG